MLLRYAYAWICFPKDIHSRRTILHYFKSDIKCETLKWKIQHSKIFKRFIEFVIYIFVIKIVPGIKRGLEVNSLPTEFLYTPVHMGKYMHLVK